MFTGNQLIGKWISQLQETLSHVPLQIVYKLYLLLIVYFYLCISPDASIYSGCFSFSLDIINMLGEYLLPHCIKHNCFHFYTSYRMFLRDLLIKIKKSIKRHFPNIWKENYFQFKGKRGKNFHFLFDDITTKYFDFRPNLIKKLKMRDCNIKLFWMECYLHCRGFSRSCWVLKHHERSDSTNVIQVKTSA